MEEKLEIFICHLKRMQKDIRSFYDRNKDTPKDGYEKEHSEQLSWSMSQRDHVIRLVEGLKEIITSDYDEWFERHNHYLASYEGEPIENYIDALMRANCMMRTASDLYYEVELKQIKV